MSSFEDAWKVVKEKIPEPKIDEEGMTDCHFPHPEDMICPQCCDHHANAGINVCYNCGADWDEYPELGFDPNDESLRFDPVAYEAWKKNLVSSKEMKKAMTDEEMVYVKMPKSMLPVIEMLTQNPEMWLHTGTDMGGDFADVTRDRPSEKELFLDDWEMKDDEMEALSGMDQWSPDFPYDLDYRLGYDRIGQGNYGESGFRYDHDRHGQRGRVEQLNMLELLSRLANNEVGHL